MTPSTAEKAGLVHFQLYGEKDKIESLLQSVHQSNSPVGQKIEGLKIILEWESLSIYDIKHKSLFRKTIEYGYMKN